MQNLIEKFGLIILLVVISFSTYSFLNAQEEVEYGSVSDSIYVTDINLNEEKISAGGNISGSFNITNAGDRVSSGVKYKVELVSIFEETLQYENEDSSTEDLTFDQISAPFSSSDLSSGINVSPGVMSIPFEYKIPNSVPEGRIGLVISTHSSNELALGYDFVEIDVSGERTKYIALLTNVSVTDKNLFKETFGALEGPRIMNEDKVELEVELFNGDEDVIKLTPKIKIYSGNDIHGEEVYSNQFNQVDVVSGEQKFSYKIPVDFSPGVYTGIIEFVDSEGISKTIASEFRYIIDNNSLKPKIGEVSYNTNNLTDTNLLVSVSYIDTPLNFRKNSDGTYKDPRIQMFLELNKNFDPDNLQTSDNETILASAENYLEGIKAEIRVKDLKKNKVIITEQVDFEDSATVIADLGKLKGVSEVMVEVDLFQNGEKIDSYVNFAEFETQDYKNIFDKIWNQYKTLNVILILIIVLIGIALAAKYSKVNKKTGISALIAVLMVGASYVVVQNTENVKAYNLDENFVTRAQITSPKPPNVTAYEPGENIRFIADMDFMYCTNSGYSLKARISRPVLVGRPHTGYGPWFNLPKGKFIQTMYNYSPLGRYDSGINVPIKAPNAPGVYAFKFEVVGVSGDWGDQENGVVRFKVAKDLCKNIRGVQENVPRGYSAAVNANGLPICNPIPRTSTLNCSASKNRLNVGENVTYTASTVTGVKANFNWYKGREFNSANLVKTQNNTAVSTYSTSYSSPGLYHTSAVAFVGGQSQQCTVVVAVGDDFWDEELDNEETTVEVVEDEYYTDDDGNRYLLDPNAPPGKIEFKMPNNLTNNTCAANWTAENVLKCSLYRNNVKAKDVEFTGSEDLAPGTYQIRCNQTRDGAEIKSETKTCTLNPNIREL